MASLLGGRSVMVHVLLSSSASISALIASRQPGSLVACWYVCGSVEEEIVAEKEVKGRDNLWYDMKSVRGNDLPECGP